MAEVLPLGIDPIVTREAASLDRTVIDARRHPGIREVAVITIIGGADVVEFPACLRLEAGSIVT